jgi:hypothetical protein
MSFVTADRVCVLQDSDGNQRQWCNPCRFDVQARVAWDLVAPVKAADSGDDDADDDPTDDERTVDEFIRLEDGTVYKTFYDYDIGGYYIDGEPIEYYTSAPWVDPTVQVKETRAGLSTHKAAFASIAAGIVDRLTEEHGGTLSIEKLIETDGERLKTTSGLPDVVIGAMELFEVWEKHDDKKAINLISLSKAFAMLIKRGFEMASLRASMLSIALQVAEEIHEAAEDGEAHEHTS